MASRLTDYANCAPTNRWRAADITIIILDDQTDDPIVTAEILTPVGTVEVMAEVSLTAKCLALTGLHIQMSGTSNRRFGSTNWRRLADAVMEKLGCDEIRIEGAPRTTGANQGRRPVPGFKRRIFPAS